MRKLLLTLDNTLDDFLKGQVNQSETIRTALYLYKDNISTPDTVAGIKQSYQSLRKIMEEKFEQYDYHFNQLQKLIDMLETRMS